MKFKAIFYPLICVAIVLAIATFLVVKKRVEIKKSQFANTQTEIVQNDDGNTGNPSNASKHNETETENDSEDEGEDNKGCEKLDDDVKDRDGADLSTNPEKEFATDIKLNCCSQIEMAINETIVFKDYLTVKPKKFCDSAKMKITTGGAVTSNLEFKNGVMSATETGCYKICFSINTSQTKTKSAILTVVVCEKCSHIKLKTNQLQLGKTYAIDEIVDNETDSEVNVGVDKKFLRFKNNKITAIKQGNTQIEFEIYDDNKICYFCFDVCVFKPTVCKIVLPELTNDSSVKTCDDALCVSYLIMYGDAVHVDQAVVAELNDDNVAEIISSDAPMILIKKLSKGSVTLKLSSASNPTITKTIVIVFE